MLDKAAPAHISARHRFGVGLTRWVADRRGCPQRWHDAVAELLTLQASYTGWLRALPATLQDTATADVLQAIVDLDLDALGAGKRRLWPLTPPPTLSSWPTCRVTLTLSAAGECHFYFARLVTFLSCADTNAASGRDRSAVAAAIYRVGYLHAVSRFFAWCEHHQIGQLADIEPLHVAAYIEALGKDFEKPTVKQHLAAIRMLFDWLVTGQVVATNPPHAVRGPKHVVKTGKTTVLDAEQARKLLDSIDTAIVVGLRDRALISVMTFAFARIGAVVAMRVEDYYPKGKRWWVRLHEKGGKRHEMPAHHTLEAYLDSYIEAAGIREGGKAPLFRSAAGRAGTLTGKPMNRVDAWRMIQRRAADLGSASRSAATPSGPPALPPTSKPAARLKTLRPWPHTKVPGPPSSMIAPAMR